MFHKRLYKVSLLTIITLNALSFLAFRSPLLNWLSFTFILFSTALIAWKDLRYGILILLGELMISSQGHLFDIYLSTFRFSMRMGIFVIILTIWGLKFLILNFQFPRKFSIRYLLFSYRWYVLFGLFISFGIINGLFQGNRLSFLYQDVNAYLFFLLLPVFITALKSKNATNYKLQTTRLLTVWAAAITWQFFVSITLLFLYGHLDLFWRFLVPVYEWFRDQRIIEVGLYDYNFYRVFMQSGLWVLTGFFVFLSLWMFNQKKHAYKAVLYYYIIILLRKLKIAKHSSNATIQQSNNTPVCGKKLFASTLLVFAITVILISLSRSFWIGGFIGFLCLAVYYIEKNRPAVKELLMQGKNLLFLTLVSIAIIAGMLIVPIGEIPGLKSLSSIPARGIETGGAAIASRWNLLPPLWEGITSNLILGKGFGAVITYKTSDPRYLETHPDNPYYTTFAFEWGWLDILYKIGVFGLLTYLLLLGSVIYKGWTRIRDVSANETKKSIYAGLSIGIIAVIIVHFFTPFLNHPLGIGYILLCDSIFRSDAQSLHSSYNL